MIDSYSFSEVNTISASKASSSNVYGKSEVDTKYFNLISCSPSTLDTLNEIAAAIHNDPNIATTLTNQISTKKYSISSANDTACAWSSGLVGDAYHYLSGGTDALALRSDGGNVSMNLLGSTAGSQEGNVLFYKPVELLSTLSLPGNVNVLSTLNAKAPLASPTFTGTVSGITSTMVGLGNCDNTSDLNKPVSTATTTALNSKANLANPTFTGTVGGKTASMVGLGNCDNTSDLNRPVSTATTTA